MKKSLLSLGLIFTILISFAQVPTNGLVAYYPFTGTSNDASGNSLDLTSNNLTYATDRFGISSAAGYFNGTSSYASLTHNSALIDFTNTFSISLWFKADKGFYARSGLLYTRMNAVGGEQGGLGWDYSQGGSTAAIDSTVSSYLPGSTVHTLQSVSLHTAQWHHATIVYEKNGKGTLYVDGMLAQQTSTYASFFEASSPMRIGATYCGTGWGAYFKGSIDDIRIYNRNLTANEVAELYDEENYATSTTDVVATSTFSVFPNPASNQVNITRLSDAHSEIQVQIINALGEVVLEKKSSLASFFINTNELGSGVYSMLLKQGENTEVKKLILE